MDKSVISESHSELRKFLRRVLIFAATPLLAYIPYLPVGIFYGEQILQRVKGPTDQQQVENSFRGAANREYDLLLLGNSRVYRGINPDQFEVPAFNFACDSDAFNQMYFKLKWVREHGKSPGIVVLGVDPFQFSHMHDARNHLYGEYFGEAYLADYPPAPYAAEKYYWRHFPKRLNPKYLLMSSDDRPFFRENGQYIRPGKALATDRVSRRAKRLPLQVSYFERILEDCRQHGTQVFLCLMPTRSEELAVYAAGQVDEFRQFIAGYTNPQVVFLDFAEDPSYVLSDYTDITHLNEVAADRFSRQLSTAMFHLNDRSSEIERIAVEEKSVPVTPVGLVRERL